MRAIKQVLNECKIKQTELANYLGLAKSTVNRIVNHGELPRGKEKKIRQQINEFFMERKIGSKGIWEEIPEKDEEPEETCEMLSQQAKKVFKLFKDPFTDDVNEAKDVFMGESTRYVSEYMYMTAKIGGMLAVIGESGSGKTTLRRLLADRIANEGLKVKVIFPRTIDKSRLTATAICDAIIEDCSSERPRRTLEAKGRQIEKILAASAGSGWSHTLIIEEAHDLTVQTLKYLKRFWEMEDGFKKLLSIILIAQPELKNKLDESRNWDAREIIRRMEVTEIEPLIKEEDLRAYLALKFKRIGTDPAGVLSEDAYKAIIKKLTRRFRSGTVHTLAYPLTVNNLVKKAMNTAATVGQQMVDAETVALV